MYLISFNNHIKSDARDIPTAYTYTTLLGDGLASRVGKIYFSRPMKIIRLWTGLGPRGWEIRNPI